MIEIHHGRDRAATEQPGIRTRHCFSSGAHYDPANVAFGRVVACDEHELAPRAGFAAHRHAGVELISWVLTGTLRHDDDAGRSTEVGAGRLQYQRAGSGITHSERNASDAEPLRFVQLWLTGTQAAAPGYAVLSPPMAWDGGSVELATGALELAAAAYTHVFVLDGRWSLAGQVLGPGDSVRARRCPLPAAGGARLLVVRVDS